MPGYTNNRDDTAPDIVRTLIEQLVQKVPGSAHRAALEVCALLRLTTESVLAADLRWRNPAWYAELHRRARHYYGERVGHTRGAEQQRVLFDYVYLHRDNPLMRPYLDWQENGTTLPDVVRDGDRETLIAMVTAYEGAESARWLDFWLARQPGGFIVYRDTTGQLAAFVAMLALHEISPEERLVDPAIRVAVQHLERQAPLRPGEKAVHFRFWMARDTYQAVSGLQSLIFGRAQPTRCGNPSAQGSMPTKFGRR